MDTTGTFTVTRKTLIDEQVKGEPLYFPVAGTKYQVGLTKQGKPAMVTLLEITHGVEKAFLSAEKEAGQVAQFLDEEDARCAEVWARTRDELIEAGVSEKDVDEHRPLRMVGMMRQESLASMLPRAKVITSEGWPEDIDNLFQNVVQRLVGPDFTRAVRQMQPPEMPLSPALLQQLTQLSSLNRGQENGTPATVDALSS